MVEVMALGFANMIGDEEVKTGRWCFVRFGVEGGAMAADSPGGDAEIAVGMASKPESSEGAASVCMSSGRVCGIGAGIVGALGARKDVGRFPVASWDDGCFCGLGEDESSCRASETVLGVESAASLGLEGNCTGSSETILGAVGREFADRGWG